MIDPRNLGVKLSGAADTQLLSSPANIALGTCHWRRRIIGRAAVPDRVSELAGVAGNRAGTVGERVHLGHWDGHVTRNTATW
jgi:hypothetical protein